MRAFWSEPVVASGGSARCVDGSEGRASSLSEAIDTNCASGRLLFHVMGALAEFERSSISERTRAEIGAARDRGARIGRPMKFTWVDVRAARVAFLTERQDISDLARKIGVSVST